MEKRSISGLFQYVELLQGERPWGHVLDAGTGVKSLQWISGLDTSSWTAVTASRGMVRSIQSKAQVQAREQDRMVIGNWGDERLLADEQFDTVLADYLLGAVEGFSPYWQDRLFHRLRPHVRGRLYMIGLEPYVPFNAETESGRVIVEIGRLRDSCLLLAGERPYREYPAGWVVRHMKQAGFRVLDVRHFPIRYRERFVNGQLDMCVRRLEKISSRLREAISDEIEHLRERALALVADNDGLRHGADYVIVAELAD